MPSVAARSTASQKVRLLKVHACTPSFQSLAAGGTIAVAWFGLRVVVQPINPTAHSTKISDRFMFDSLGSLFGVRDFWRLGHAQQNPHPDPLPCRARERGSEEETPVLLGVSSPRLRRED